MSKLFSELGQEVKDKILERFNEYGMDGEFMYNETTFFSNEMKALPDNDFLQIFSMKEISHKLPQSEYQEYGSEPWNVFLEDVFENRSRSSNIATSDEINAAYYDQIQDTYDLDIDDDGIIDISNYRSDFDSLLDFETWDIDISDYLFT